MNSRTTQPWKNCIEMYKTLNDTRFFNESKELYKDYPDYFDKRERIICCTERTKRDKHKKEENTLQYLKNYKNIEMKVKNYLS